MASLTLRIQHDFHAVGQGLFAAGSIGREENRLPKFRWIYDCGTSSKKELVERAIEYLSRTSTEGARLTRPKLDLVVLSHFDNDHISGLVALLARFSVGTLLLPFIPLWQRLCLAYIEETGPSQDLMQFFLNPVAYISELKEVQVDRILFVPASDGDGPADDSEANPTVPDGDSPWELLAEAGDLPDRGQATEMRALQATGAARRIAVDVMRSGGRLSTGRIWEFVPYNDADLAGIPKTKFRGLVTRRAGELLGAPSNAARKRALAAVKEAYDREFGNSAKQRNAISLFLYVGPVHVIEALRVQEIATKLFVHGQLFTWNSAKCLGRCSILYTGDGYLETTKRLKRLGRYLGRKRIANISCLQVMHHGAKGNWHAGVGCSLAPDFSVFSSDPDHVSLAHPYSAVLRDFWCFGPVQVDRQCMASFEVVYEYT